MPAVKRAFLFSFVLKQKKQKFKADKFFRLKSTANFGRRNPSRSHCVFARGLLSISQPKVRFDFVREKFHALVMHSTP